MKKLLFICFFTMFVIINAKEEEIVFINYSYIADNYHKTQNYNKNLANTRDTLIKKYNSKNSEQITKEKKEELENSYNSKKNKLTEEIIKDIDIAVALIGYQHNYNIIIEKNFILYRDKKIKNISDDIIDFLNFTYDKKIILNEKEILKIKKIISC